MKTFFKFRLNNTLFLFISRKQKRSIFTSINNSTAPSKDLLSYMKLYTFILFSIYMIQIVIHILFKTFLNKSKFISIQKLFSSLIIYTHYIMFITDIFESIFEIIIMKHQQVTVDMTNMVFTACSYLALAGAVWIFLRLIQACFWLPKHLKRQNDVQRMLQDKVNLNTY